MEVRPIPSVLLLILTDEPAFLEVFDVAILVLVPFLSRAFPQNDYVGVSTPPESHYLLFDLPSFPLFFSKVTDLIQGIQLGMVPGEGAVSHVTKNLQFTVTSNLVTSTGNTVLEPPLSKYLSQRSMPPRIVLGPLGLSACHYSNRYAYMSILQWSNNPYEMSSSVKSPLLRVSSEQDVDWVSNSEAQAMNTKGNRAAVAPELDTSSVPLYMLTLPFSRLQHFNFSAMKFNSSVPRHERSNFTVPVCTQRSTDSYTHCKGCNVSSFTNDNVTYSCFDISQLCASSRSRRSLRNGDREGWGDRGNYEGEDSCDGSDRQRVRDRAGYGDRETQKGSLSQRLLRRDFRSAELQLEVQHSAAADPQGGSARIRSLTDSGSDTSSTSMLQGATYGTLVESVISQLSSVLSSNPFNLDIAKCKVVLGFTMVLSAFIILMLTYLLRLDHYEALDKKYVMKERDAEIRMLIINDIKDGGKGDLAESYQEYALKSKQNRKLNGSIMGGIIKPVRKSTFLPEERGDTSGARKSHIYTSESPMHTHRRGVSGSANADAYATRATPGTNTICSTSGSSCMVECDANSNPESEESHTTRAAITEYMHKLFPGRSIFVGKRNLLNIILLNHDYFRMFAGSNLRKSRTIRFLGLLCVILPCIFTDTVFFGVYFPSNFVCAANLDQVRVALFCCSTATSFKLSMLRAPHACVVSYRTRH